jgi:hypothetical protein
MPARYIASTALGNNRYYYGVVISAQVRSTARCKLIIEVHPGQGETGRPPKETRNAGPGGAVRGAEGKTKRRNKGRRLLAR